MQALRTLTDWLEVWCKWSPVTGISWCVSLVIGSVVAQVAGLALPGVASLAMGGLVAGALIGLTQWAMLSLQVKQVGSASSMYLTRKSTMVTSDGGHDRHANAWTAWLMQARERFIEFFERRALVTRAQISLARMKHAEQEKPPHEKLQDQKAK